MKKNIRTWLSIVLAVLVIITIKTYVPIVHELVLAKGRLRQELRAKQLLEKELKTTKEQLFDVKGELESVQSELKRVTIRLSGVEKDNLALQEEKVALEARLHSLEELKKAIRQVKIERYQQRVQEYFAKKKRQQEIDVQESAQGNGGFMVKNGRSLYRSRVEIEIKPVY